MSSMRSSRPPSGCTEVGSWTLGDSRQLSALRHSLQDALDGGRDELDEVPEKVALVASELATNALRHGLPPTVVRLLRSDEAFVLDVADHDTGVIPQPEDEEPDSEGGRGLQIARRLALDVGWYAADTTKHVWAQFAAPPATRPEPRA